MKGWIKGLFKVTLGKAREATPIHANYGPGARQQAQSVEILQRSHSFFKITIIHGEPYLSLYKLENNTLPLV
jgi:hypothetical protein